MPDSASFGGFGDFAGRTWLNTAHQGALPLVAAQEAGEAVSWKLAPHELTGERFADVPRRLRAALGSLVNAPVDEIVLANSASYGLHLIANSYPWRAGDEILVMAGDFPSDILPWLMIARRCGVRVSRIKPRNHVVAPDELEAAITPRTRLFCTTWVHSFSGFAIDLEALGAICRSRDVTFVLNGSQALGARSIDVCRAPLDALTCAGWKWLCGPYGTGFCWIRARLRERLQPIKAYWLAMQTADDLAKEIVDAELRDGLGMQAFDIFATANFFNFKPWAAAIEYLLGVGVESILAHDKNLVEGFVKGLDFDRFDLLSPCESGPRCSTLVFFSHRERARNPVVYRALADAGIDIALRGGLLRLSPHLYNSPADIDRALAVLNTSAY